MQGSETAAAASASSSTLWERSYQGGGTFSVGGGSGGDSSGMLGLGALGELFGGSGNASNNWWNDPRKWALLAYLISGDPKRGVSQPAGALSSSGAAFTRVSKPRRSLLEILAASL